MNKQTTVEASTLAQAMAAAFAEIESAKKDANNPHFKAKFASLGSVMDAIKPALTKHGLFFTQASHVAEDGVCVETIIHHSSGETVSCGKLYVPANKRDAQGFGSALTYARRYGLMTAFGVPAEDDDGNAAVQTAANNGYQDRKQKLVGTYDTLPKLETAAKAFVHTLQGMDSLDDFNEWGTSKDVVEFVSQLKRDLPDWWSGGASLPTEFIPLKALIAQKKWDLEQLSEQENRERTVLDAG